MIVVWGVLGTLLPWAAGVGLVRAWDRGGWAWQIGAGWLVGRIVVVGALLLMFVLTGASQARGVLLLIAGIGAVAWWHARRADAVAADILVDEAPAQFRLPTWLIVVLGFVLVARLPAVAVGNLAIPIRGDDAISIWLYRAKVMAALDALPLDPDHAYYKGGSLPQYPVGVSVSAAWLPLLAGRWHASLAAAPWLSTGISLVLMVWGGVRRWAGRDAAWLCAYGVGSLPLLSMHVYRPGYADLPLAAALAAAAVALVDWRRTGSGRALVMGVVFAMAAGSLKREAPLLAGVLVAGILGAHWRRLGALPRGWRVLGLMAAGAGAALVGAAVGFGDLVDSVRAWDYHPGVWSALGRHLFGWSSFHILFWVLPVVLLVVATWSGARDRRATVWVVGLMLALPAGVFLFTPQARFALNDQTPSRLFLQVAPAAVVLLAAALAGRRDAAFQMEGGATDGAV